MSMSTVAALRRRRHLARERDAHAGEPLPLTQPQLEARGDRPSPSSPRRPSRPRSAARTRPARRRDRDSCARRCPSPTSASGSARRGRVVAGRHPVHRREATDEVDVEHVQPPEAEVVEIDPVAGALVSREIGGAGLRRLTAPRDGAPRPSASAARPPADRRSSPAGSRAGSRVDRLWRLWVCMAIVLMRNKGRPRASSAYGMIDANGCPGCLRDSVASVPVRPRWASVRARSANVGSGIAGPSDGAGRTGVTIHHGRGARSRPLRPAPPGGSRGGRDRGTTCEARRGSSR